MPDPVQPTDVDAVVVGAGFGGLRTLHELRGLGRSVRVIEAGTDVGGTWYWNRYPGARTDSESWVYAYSFSKDLQEEWEWAERFPTQPEVLCYLRHVADRFNMRKDIEFTTRVLSAVYDETRNTWTVTTDRGTAYRCTYFISAVGLLSVPYVPPFPGIEDFSGEWYITGRWPKEPVNFTDKKVAVVGTGATAIQAIPIIAQTARDLTVFQRTPNYVMPGRNYLLTPDERQAIRRDYDRIWTDTREHFFGFAMKPTGRMLSETPAAEQRRILDGGWEAGGFRFIFETFDDLLVNPASNNVAAEFVREKIRAIVHDPETAELLCPKDYPLAGKRPPLGHFYYEAFNRDNVRLVDVSVDPISSITERGLSLRSGAEHDADMIILATGFDAATGSVLRMDVRGRDGVRLAEHWREGPRTHLGIMVDAFPNFFMVSGPQSPFANIPVVQQVTVEWLRALLTHMDANGLSAVEPKPAAVQAWRQWVTDLLNATVLKNGKNSWLVGDNVPGKPHDVLFHLGGVGLYRRDCQRAIDNGYADFSFSTQAELTKV